MINRFSIQLLPVFLLLFCFNQQVAAFDFRGQLKPVKRIQYDHQHIQKNKITGYTKIEIKTMLKENKTCFLEINQNLDRNRRAFSEKKTWYDANSGQLVLYTESDHRTRTRITNRMSGNHIITEIRSGEETLKIKLEMEKGLVPFEVLTPFLQQSLPELQEKGHLFFTLYLPVMAIELKRKGLPASFSKFEMKASVVERQPVKTPIGIKPGIRIKLKPTSFLVNAVLPKEKTTFYFTFMTESPHLLLSFQEHKTRSILSIYDP